MKEISLWKVIPALVIGLNFSLSAVKQTKSLQASLEALPGVQISRAAPTEGFNQVLEVRFRQPLNHNSPEEGTFTQRVFLSHISTSAPTVFVPIGGGASRNRIFEISTILKANQVLVPQRFQAGAEPAERNWSLLTPGQIIEDYHHMVDLLQKVYRGPWINGGISRGGTEALLHRSLYPDDFIATVVFVAPLAMKDRDPRIDHFLKNQVGSALCRRKVFDFQRRLLKHSEDLLPEVKSICKKSGRSFTLGHRLMLELHTLEYPFSFWQWGSGNCMSIPDQSASPEELHRHLLETVGSYAWYCDAANKKREPSTYLSFTGFGYYGYMTEHLRDLLAAVPPDPTDKLLGPYDTRMTFNPQSMRRLSQWLKTEGHRIIAIYGENDPWTACAVDLPSGSETLKIVVPGANHGVRIKHLSPAQRERVLHKLRNWLYSQDANRTPRGSQ